MEQDQAVWIEKLQRRRNLAIDGLRSVIAVEEDEIVARVRRQRFQRKLVDEADDLAKPKPGQEAARRERQSQRLPRSLRSVDIDDVSRRQRAGFDKALEGARDVQGRGADMGAHLEN